MYNGCSLSNKTTLRIGTGTRSLASAPAYLARPPQAAAQRTGSPSQLLAHPPDAPRRPDASPRAAPAAHKSSSARATMYFSCGRPWPAGVHLVSSDSGCYHSAPRKQLGQPCEASLDCLPGGGCKLRGSVGLEQPATLGLMFNLVVQRTSYLHTRLAVGRLRQGVPVGARPLSLLVSGGGGGQWKQAVVAGPSRKETSSVMAEQHQQRRSESVDAVDPEMMSEAYGAAYSTRSGDDGFGQIYTETVKVHRPVHQQGGDDSGLPESNHNPARALHVVSLSKAGQEDLDNESDEQPGSIPADFDTSQGSPVEQKEHGRHSLREDACDDGKGKAGTAGAST